MLKIGIIGVYKNLDEGTFTRLNLETTAQVEATGLAIPYIIPANTKNISHHIQECDGFIIPGGEDIDPSIYESECSGSVRTQKDNDIFELEFIDQIFKAEKPILGICRGMQLLNIYFGGTLKQDLIEKKLHEQFENRYKLVHKINIEKESFLHEVFGNILKVNSIHHQAIDKLGTNLQVTALSDDGYIEAIEYPEKNIIGVQWHPEFLPTHQILFQEIFKKHYKK